MAASVHAMYRLPARSIVIHAMNAGRTNHGPVLGSAVLGNDANVRPRSRDTFMVIDERPVGTYSVPSLGPPVESTAIGETDPR
ncbi:MAG: hypothetical protein ACRDJM_04965 [Actinomycetota bacterium]